MHAQSVASNSALERQAFIRRQAEEIEALKIENAKLRRNVETLNVAVSALYGQEAALGDDLDPAVRRGDLDAVSQYLEDNLSEV